MRKEKQITVGGREVTVRELTVAQVDRLMQANDEQRPVYAAELLLNSPIPVEAVCASTGLSVDELHGEVTPSELAEIWAAVAEVNDFLSSLCDRLGRVASALGKAASGPPSAG